LLLFAGLQQMTSWSILRIAPQHPPQNHAVLRSSSPLTPSDRKAQSRGDLVSVNHRVAALLASYFDVLFALNRVLHPGEKRLLAFAAKNCPLLPKDIPATIENLLKSTAAGDANLMKYTHQLVDDLDELLLAHGFDPQTSAPIK
jgi:hypothetical protein